ncbi:MAG: hypothetical protein A3G76_01960 [Acidobacteria bacterium RIFCSPLOWO2_12_FULL_65_11]|nr:MAG: hypothetical protein A3H95_12925 [Acidobacteria bacterium RIFCSPLOWO2_02_FULL_64_15]OFW28701.1 MAG: hypothetical protein A3G76_01960 [Acidobacteria bacterium RIFCSPLOWO2_12_FULL_65_11]
MDEHGILSTHIRPGRQVRLVDISADGALIEAAHRLLPGKGVELHLKGPERRISITGRLLRCTIARLQSSAICYRGAILFDVRLPWLADDSPSGYRIPSGDTLTEQPEGVDATRPIVCSQDVLHRLPLFSQQLRARRHGT